MPVAGFSTHTGDMTEDRPARTSPRPVAPRHLEWLLTEIAAWQATGVVDDRQAAEIRRRYVAVPRFSLTRLLLLLGGAFVGVGVLWLVAANLDSLSPSLRFVAVVILWLGFVATAEVLADRQPHDGADGDESASPLVGAFRLLAAVSFGAVVFQAAQSLQVPAYEPALVGVWGLGGLLYAYAVRGIAPLLVGITTTTAWYVWEVFEAAEDGMGFVLPVLVAGVLAGALPSLHAERLPRFSEPWRAVCAVLALLGLFVAAFPSVDVERVEWSVPLVVGIVLALAAVAAATARSAGQARLEPLAPLVAGVAGVLLVLWEPPEPVQGVVTGEAYAHASVSVAVYVLAAGWFAVLGALRESSQLTFLATAALVLFTTAQSFAVFAPIISGATLFLLLGVIFLASGYVFDRGRRHLVANLEGASA